MFGFYQSPKRRMVFSRVNPRCVRIAADSGRYGQGWKPVAGFKNGDWGTSLVVRWLRLHASTAGAWIPSLVGELRNCMLCGMVKKKIKNKKRMEIEKRRDSGTLIHDADSVLPACCHQRLFQYPEAGPVQVAEHQTLSR